jgi:hypothetical protein
VKRGAVELYVLYKYLGGGEATFDVAPHSNRNTAVRTFTNRKAAINYARPINATIARIMFDGVSFPAVIEIIDPSEEPTT